MITKNFVEGVNIIAKYLDPDNYNLNCEHDQLYFGEYDIVTDKKDIDRLIELGWFESEDAWSAFS
jgi:hypothetical protein